ncbi:MAG TPA: pseudouridine-5'-phosphate glycosidase [Anaerolineaceae bacterium]|nr:pseudouridine-5'-phosphate glycosidase [Anaerolineaceae bacterium]HPT24556.1 pseudouridine-5'-phosphate glycosidase [Anaerolineaceae bacterium]
MENTDRLPLPSQRAQFVRSEEVEKARLGHKPIVALESTVITHGLPWPENLDLALSMERTVRENGAVPATIAILDGQVRVGLSGDELEALSKATGVRKVSVRDFGPVIGKGLSGGTTVAATMFVAEKTGIKVFATGGIGGVHRDAPYDVSADLPQLGRSPVVVVCAGAKSILDIPKTAEYLETQGVPVIGYQTDAFPAFYSVDSGLKVEFRADTALEAAQIAEAHWNLGLRSGVLLVVPPPAATAVPIDRIEEVIKQALAQAVEADIHGSAMTPFLLARVKELSGGDSLRANLALLLNNAAVAAQVAVGMSQKAPMPRYL